LKTLSFHPEAIREAVEAAEFYEERQKHLGERFQAKARILEVKTMI